MKRYGDNQIGFYTGKVTINDVRASKPKRIYYGVHTCWWTHNPNHLYIHPDHGLPCNPLSGILLETSDIEGFLSLAEKNVDHYGE